MTNIIELNHLSVSFASKKSNNKKNGESNIIHAVEDATLHIEKGDIYGVIGYSGAGKSTLVRTINLLQKPTEGQIIINGEIVFDTNHPVHLSGAKLRAFRQKKLE